MINYSYKLYIKVATMMVGGAILVAFLLSYISYVTALDEVKKNNHTIIEQLVVSMKKTASLAAYINEKELTKEIVNGLSSNILVSAVTIESQQGFRLSSGIIGDELFTIPLEHPFLKNNIIGQLIIYPNSYYIQQQAQSAAKKQAKVLILYSLIIAVFISVVVFHLLTKPLQRLTEAFEKVNPFLPETMTMPRYNKSDEIGLLTLGINSQLKQLQLYISNEKRLREKTEQLERKFRLIFERASAGICLVDTNNKLVTTNQAFNSMLLNNGFSYDDELPMLFENPYDVIYYLDQIRSNKLTNSFAIDLKRGHSKRKNSGWIQCLFSAIKDERKSTRDASGVLVEVIMHDVTERTEREIRTRYEADHDPLTRLKNRRSGERSLADLLYRSIERNRVMMLMMIDLDKFKPINDNYGHDAGDAVLKEVSKRMMSIFNRKNDLCVRCGGDEFVIARSYSQFDINRVKRTAQKLIKEIRQPIMLSDDTSCQVGASIGVVIAPYHGANMTDLLASADRTMYKVKQLGRNRFEICDSPLNNAN